MSPNSKIDKKERFIELRAKEMSYDGIVNELGVSKPTLIKWGRELELEICNRRALEIELLQTKYFVTKTRRIELYGKYLSLINEEFLKRDLTEIPTEKLYDMAMKTISSLKQEEMIIRLKDKGTLDDTFASLHESYVEWNV